jgi:hypothetical protein
MSSGFENNQQDQWKQKSYFQTSEIHKYIASYVLTHRKHTKNLDLKMLHDSNTQDPGLTTVLN